MENLECDRPHVLFLHRVCLACGCTRLMTKPDTVAMNKYNKRSYKHFHSCGRQLNDIQIHDQTACVVIFLYNCCHFKYKIEQEHSLRLVF